MLLPSEQAEQERQRADQERQQAEQARQRADQERQRADQERQARLDSVSRLRALGLSTAEVAAALALPIEVVAQVGDAPAP